MRAHIFGDRKRKRRGESYRTGGELDDRLMKQKKENITKEDWKSNTREVWKRGGGLVLGGG